MPAPRKVTVQQIVKLLEYLENYKDLWLGGSLGNCKGNMELWKEIAKILNHTPGDSKSVHGWQRYWVEMKSRVRRKKALGKRAILPHEKRLLALVGKLRPDDKLEDDDETETSFVDPSGSRVSPARQDHGYVALDPMPMMEDPQCVDGEQEEEYEIKYNIEDTKNQEDEVPKWVREMEERRLALEERTTIAIEKMAGGIASISGSVDRMSRAMVSLVGSMKLLEDSLKSEK